MRPYLGVSRFVLSARNSAFSAPRICEINGAFSKLYFVVASRHLYSGGGVLGEVHERAGVRDEASANQLTDESCEIGRERRHALLQVLVQARAVLADRYYLHEGCCVDDNSMR